MNSHLKTKDTSKIKVRLYHKSKQLSSSFSTRDALTDNHHVVYQFNCPESDCTSTYIGYTTNRLSYRACQHRYSPSKIFEHFNTAHGQSTISNISKHFTILYGSCEVQKLKIAEAFYIKTRRPDINIKFNVLSVRLNIIWFNYYILI